MSYYQFIDGVRYTRDLLDAADQFTQGRGESRISTEEIQSLYKMAEDGARITDTERRTLRYIGENFTLTDKAKRWLAEQLVNNPKPDALAATIRRVVREEFGLSNLQWIISPEEVSRQEQILPRAPRLFEAALRGAIEAFLFRSIDQLSLGAFLNRRGNVITFDPPTTEESRAALDSGTLYLVPMEEKDQEKFPHDLPEGLDLDRQWIFILEIPEFFPALFIAFVSRTGQFQFSKGYISTKPPVDSLAKHIIRDLLGFKNLAWEFDSAEVERQLSLQGGQNFGNALFAALNGGIFNGESSISFRDSIRLEIWQDPDRRLNDYMFDYLETGTIYLVPENYQETDLFVNSFDLFFKGEWYFGIEMPKRTQTQYLVNIPRSIQDGVTGWNDGFEILGEFTVQEALNQVLGREFRLSNLNLIFNEETYIAQRDQFGPQWRTPSTLLRQAINTILDDYLTKFSVFNLVARQFSGSIDPNLLDNTLTFRSAIRNQTLEFLQDATIELLPIDLPDNNPINGEPIETFWQFFVLLPRLQKQGFWVIIPRFPEDDQQSYVYGEF